MDNKEYQRQYYQKNKEKKKAQQAKYNKAHKAEQKEYRAKWFQENKTRIAAKRRANHSAVKKTEDERRADSVMIGPTEAAAMLGLSLRSFRQWVTDGKIASTKSPTGRRLIRREDVEELTQTVGKGATLKSMRTGDGQKQELKLVRTAGAFTVPEGFDLITQYDELTEYTLAFAAKKIGFLLLVGSPGSGKSRQMKTDLAGKGVVWIDNHVTNLGLYCAVYEGRGTPVVMDDVNHFLNNKTACSLLKALTQTEKEKSISWESTVKALDERQVPRSYTTTSPVCLIGNLWDASNADYAAIQDRSLPVAFYPTAETIHNRVIELGWCDDAEIVRYIGDNLAEIPQPSMREYYLAQTYKRAGMDWKKKLQSIWSAL